MRRFVLPAFACVWFVASALAVARPNILFIPVDDLRPELGCYGSAVIQSPHIDRLASRGLVFDRAYCQQAVCNPSRVSLLSGLRPDTTKVWDLITPMRDRTPDILTIPQHFKNNGYYAVGMGKIFHNTFPDPPSWTVGKQPEPTGYFAYPREVREKIAAMQAEAKKAGKTAKEISGKYRGPVTDDEDVPDGQRIDGALTDLALKHMRMAARQPLPFFLAVGYIRPHLPFCAPRKYWDLYDRDKIPMAQNDFMPINMPAVAFGDINQGGFYELRSYMDMRKAPSPFVGSLSEAECRRLKHGYYASVSHTDAQVGRLLDELDRLKLADNTIIILWGDHGWKLGEHHSWCKQTNFEIDTRAPLIMAAPGTKSVGKHSGAIVEFIDIFPTLCELAGLPTPGNLEGKSLAKIIHDPTAAVKEAAFSQFPRKLKGGDYMGYAMRTDRYRYVEWLDQSNWKIAEVELYDERKDPDENTNIAGEPENQPLLKQLSEKLWKTLPYPSGPVR